MKCNAQLSSYAYLFFSRKHVMRREVAPHSVHMDLQTYSGKGDSGSGKFTMQYQLEGDPDRAAALCKAVGRMPSVLSWSLGCSLPDRREGYPSPISV